MIIILLGAPGAGKGTQAIRLSASRGLVHVSTGDLFRENAKNETALGKKAREYMDAGKLVPDELVLDMLFDRVGRDDCSQGYLLDGFPRTLGQAEALGARLGEQADLCAIDIQVGDETIVERASGRLLCRENGHIQHTLFDPPAVAGVCNTCGGELYQREDDRPDVVRERLRVYYDQTAPLVQFYQSKGILKSVDGERTPDEVFAQLDQACAQGD